MRGIPDKAKERRELDESKRLFEQKRNAIVPGETRAAPVLRIVSWVVDAIFFLVIAFLFGLWVGLPDAHFDALNFFNRGAYGFSGGPLTLSIQVTLVTYLFAYLFIPYLTGATVGKLLFGLEIRALHSKGRLPLFNLASRSLVPLFVGFTVMSLTMFFHNLGFPPRIAFFIRLCLVGYFVFDDCEDNRNQTFYDRYTFSEVVHIKDIKETRVYKLGASAVAKFSIEALRKKFRRLE